MSGQPKPQHPFVVYREIDGKEVPVAYADAADAAEAVRLIEPKWPRSKFLIGSGSAGTFRAVSAYEAPLADLQRVALMAQTGLVAATANNTAVAAEALREMSGFVKAAMSASMGRH